MNTTPAIYVPDSIIRPTIPLAIIDGGIITPDMVTAVSSALTNVGNSDDVIAAYQVQAVAGDYPNLLAVTSSFADIQP